jgi:hypothetical protein
VQYDLASMAPDPTDMFNEPPPLSMRFPSLRLWYAVLEDALEEIGALPRFPQRQISYKKWKETVQWIQSQDETQMQWVGSFSRIVFALKVPPDRVHLSLEQFRCECCDRLVLQEPCLRVVKVRKPRARRKRSH